MASTRPFSFLRARPHALHLSAPRIDPLIWLELPVTGSPIATRSHHTSTKRMPSVECAHRDTLKMNTPSEMSGKSGRLYVVERALQDKGLPFGSVLFARHGNEKLVLKGIPRENFKSRISIYERVGSNPFLRGLLDTIPEQSMLVFQYMNKNLLELAQKSLSLPSTKRILKDALRGLAALHERDIVHNDVKANNILIDVKEEEEEGTDVERVQLADMEDAAHIPPGSILEGAQLGNWMWRSPEAHAQGPVGKASDMFSFGVVCIYAVIKRVIFAVDDQELAPGEERLAIVLERQISYFADEDGLHGLLGHLGDKNPWCQVFEVLKSGFNRENPRRPFSLWRLEYVDEDFKDLISRLTNFDPAKRMTAQEALGHRWFVGV